MKVQHWAMVHGDCVWGRLTKLLSIFNKDIMDRSLVSIPSGSESLSAAMLCQKRAVSTECCSRTMSHVINHAHMYA